MARERRGRPPVRPARAAARGGAGLLRASAASRSRSRSSTTSRRRPKADGAPMPPTTRLRARPVRRPVQGPARRDHGQDRAVQAARRRRRVLARRREAADAPADLRHGLADAGGARRVPLAARGGEEARPPPARRPARPVQLPRRLARARRSGTPRASGSGGRSRARCASSRSAAATRRSSTPIVVSEKLWRAVRPLGPLPRQHVPGRVRGADVQPQADELPRVDVHLPARGCARTATCRCASTSTAGSTATSGPARCPASPGSASSSRTTPTSTSGRTSSTDEIEALLGEVREAYGWFGLEPRFAFATKPDKAIGDPALWERAEATHRGRARPRRTRLRASSRRTARSTPRRSTSTSTTPSAASGRWRRSRST